MSKKCTLKAYLHTEGLTINTIDFKVVIIVLILKHSSLTSKLNDIFKKIHIPFKGLTNYSPMFGLKIHMFPSSQL
jgi:hypothetical protein